jgi:hypothetical protein
LRSAMTGPSPILCAAGPICTGRRPLSAVVFRSVVDHWHTPRSANHDKPVIAVRVQLTPEQQAQRETLIGQGVDPAEALFRAAGLRDPTPDERRTLDSVVARDVSWMRRRGLRDVRHAARIARARGARTRCAARVRLGARSGLGERRPRSRRRGQRRATATRAGPGDDGPGEPEPALGPSSQDIAPLGVSA